MDLVDSIYQGAIHMFGIVSNMTNALSGKHRLDAAWRLTFG